MAHRKGFSQPPEMLLPSQMASQTARSPECRLIAAVLLDAALQLSRHGSKGAAEAERWIRRSDGGDEAFSFVGVCEALQLEPTYLARGLLRWQARGASAAKLPTRHSGRVARARHREHGTKRPSSCAPIASSGSTMSAGPVRCSSRVRSVGTLWRIACAETGRSRAVPK